MNDYLKRIYQELKKSRDSFYEMIRVELNHSMSDDYTDQIAENICDDVAEDVWETADHEKWNMSDLHLAIGRVFMNKLEIGLY